jgi:hypothetical protein
MAVEKGFTYIEFARMKHLLDFPIPDEELREITYVANCTNFRRLLINTYGKDDLDIDQEIANNPDTRLTYLGYRRFLESDLKYIFPPTKDRTKNGYRRDVKFLAKQMLMRGYVSIAPFVLFQFPNWRLVSNQLPVYRHLRGQSRSHSLITYDSQSMSPLVRARYQSVFSTQKLASQRPGTVVSPS